jgi:AraC-like DNA-binding protein
MYLNPNLSLQTLAVALNIPSWELSQLIHDAYSVTFYDFINRYRVNEFKSRIKTKQYQHLTLLAIANECGFNSKSTFNELFKRFEGITPSAYKKKTQSD